MEKIRKYIRLFLRDRISLLLGIGSLILGINVSLVIDLWYLNEVNYDTFHPDADNTYRVGRQFFLGGESKRIGTDFAPMGKHIASELPEVTDAVRIYHETEDMRLHYEGKTFSVSDVCVVDSNFFQFFNYELKQGLKEAFHKHPNGIILDEKTANEVFPNEDPMGKVVQLQGEREVIGILKELPTNTHLKIHALIPMQGVPNLDNAPWGNKDMYLTYVKIPPKTDLKALAKKIEQYAVSSFPQYKRIKIEYFVEPIRDIHLSTQNSFDAEMGIKKANPKMLQTFLLVGFIILLIACINFINLFISGAFLRAKAIGIKKMNGAGRVQIILDFVRETFLYSLFASLISIFLCLTILLPYFSQFVGYKLQLNLLSWQFWSILIACNLFVAACSGLLPGLYMSGFQALETLKGRFRGRRIIALQKSLVIIQFTASIVLLISVFVIHKQVRFMKEVDLGFDKEQLVYIEIPDSYVNKITSLQQELEKSPLIKETCLSKGTTLNWTEGNDIAKAETPDETILSEIRGVQHSYFSVYGLQIIEGSNTILDAMGKGSESECLINEEAGKRLGLQKPYVGKQINVGFRGIMTISGVVKNAYTKALTQEVDPQVYVSLSNIWGGMTLSVKTSSKEMKPVVELLRKQWEENETQYPFEYAFLDKDYEALYRAQEQSGALASWAMGIALFLSVGGLWGMARYSADRRTKEIGVRKVNGATILEVIGLLNAEFLKWVLFAFVLAIPIAFFAMQEWLKDYALRTEISWWIFAIAGLLAILVAALTVTWQSLRAASRNPVDALRYE